jgi:hypothetical protein
MGKQEAEMRNAPCWPLLAAVFVGALFMVARESRGADSRPYVVVDTGQAKCYDARSAIRVPKPGKAFYGQDANYQGVQAAYRDNGDGTVSDLNTGLMWQQNPGAKKTYAQAVAGAMKCRAGGYDDWRLPSIKELYSLMDFSGIDLDPRSWTPSQARPFIDSDVFAFRYGDPMKQERLIDSQWATSSIYGGKVMHGRWMDVHGAGCQRSDPKDGDPAQFARGRGPQGDAIRILNYVRCVRGG